MKKRKLPSKTAASAAVPQARLLRLVELFRAGQHAAMEAAAERLAAEYPNDGQAWKAWGTAQLLQGKDSRQALRRALALMPGDAGVAANLAAALAASGELDAAAECYRRALRIEPQSAPAHSNLGDVLTRQGHWQAAADSCREALRLQPALAAAHLNLGNALAGQALVHEAVASYRNALALSPQMAEAHLALGLALKRQGLRDEAVGSLEQAVRLRPQHAPARDELGVLLHGLGRTADALAQLREAQRLQPRAASIHFHLGNLLADLQQADEAVQCFRSAAQLEPARVEHRLNLGAALLQRGDPDAAVDVLHEALRLQPALAQVRGNLGNALMAQGRFSAALQQLQEAVAGAGDDAVAHGNLGHLLKAIGQPEAALAHLRKALALEPDAPHRHSEVLFAAQYLPAAAGGRDAGLVAARRFGALVSSRARPQAQWPNERDPERCLRVGFVSGDLRSHPVGYFVESVWTALAERFADRVTLTAYANQRGFDALSKRLQAVCHGWRAVADRDDAELAAIVRADGIDVLIDLAGHTLHNRLPMMARRAAPVQAGWLGWCATSGVSEMDAFIGDPWIVPEGSEAAFCERVVRLPQTFLCMTPPPCDLPVGGLPALRGEPFTFGCFNQLAKLNDEVLAGWGRVLHERPDSRLALMAQALQDAGVRDRLAARFARHGIRDDRLVLHPAQDRSGYLAAHAGVDMALDPFPYPGGTTSLDAAWMGVPVLTMAGESALSRQGVTIARNLGLDDWIASDADDYVERALRHADDPHALAALRAGLRATLLRSPLCDAPRFAAQLERCVRGLWRDWCRRG